MQISSLDSKVIVTDDLQKDLEMILESYKKNKKFIVVDENTLVHCLPLIKEFEALKNAVVIELKSGENHKSIDSTVEVWNSLNKQGADRKSLVINLGGGMIGDLGGFAASTFKRGIDFINIPTTLLAQVDASIGGKLGINFNGLKNEVGIFKTPRFVIIDTVFFKTLDKNNLLSGFAEMIKHSIIYSISHWAKIKQVIIDILFWHFWHVWVF